MRITLIAPFALHPKGTTRWRVLPLARALAAQGHAVRVVIPPYDWPAHSGLAWRDRGVDLVNAALPARLGAAGQLLLVFRQAAPLLGLRRPALGHLLVRRDLHQVGLDQRRPQKECCPLPT